MRRSSYFGILAIVVVSSWLSSWWVVHNGYDYVLNGGIGLGLINEISIGVSVVVLLFFVGLARQMWGGVEEMERIGLVIVAGGGVATIIQRVQWGGIVDYLWFAELFRYTVADGWLTLGVVLIMFESVIKLSSRRRYANQDIV